MTYKTLIPACCLLLTTACAPVIKNNNEGTDGFTQKDLQKAESQFCSKGQTLQALNNGTDVLFSELNYHARVFAFTKPEGDDCIIRQNVNDTWTSNGANLWFNLNPNSDDNCLKNHSLWEITNTTTNGFGQYYYLRNIGDPGQRLLEMNAHQAVRGTYAKDKVGLKLLTCQ